MSYTIPLIVDNSMLSTFRTCQTKGRWSYLHHLATSETSVDLHAGGVFAKAVEHLYRSIYTGGLDLAHALTSTEFLFEKAWGDFIPQKKTTKSKHNTWQAVLSYADRYSPPNDPIEPWLDGGVDPFEFTFALPLDPQTTGIADFPLHPSGDPFLYAGRFDLLGRYHGLPAIRDDKSTKGIGTYWFNQWDLRSQFLGYLWAMSKLGYPVSIVVIRGVAILTNEIKHAELIKEYPSFLVERWLHQTAKTLHALIAAVNTNDFDLDLGEACAAYGGCPYVDLCKSKNAADWFESFETREWHPLARTPDDNQNQSNLTPKLGALLP